MQLVNNPIILNKDILYDNHLIEYAIADAMANSNYTLKLVDVIKQDYGKSTIAVSVCYTNKIIVLKMQDGSLITIAHVDDYTIPSNFTIDITHVEITFLYPLQLHPLN